MRVFSFSDWLTNAGSDCIKDFSLNQSYQRISWVYSCINITATTASSAALHFYNGEAKEASNRITDSNHPVNQLFQTPNEPEIPSLRELLFRTFTYLGITGELFWVFTRKGGNLTTLEIKTGLKPILNRNTEKLMGWKYTANNGKVTTYTVQQVLPVLNFNPADPYSGMSPLLAARLSVESEFNIAGWNTSFFKSGMKNPMLLQAKGTLTKNQKADIKKEIANYYSGIEGAHGALLLQGNIDVTPLKMSPKDIDFVQGKKLNREEVCSIFGVPPALVGIFEYSNYSNVKEQRKIFWENTILPRMEKISDLLQTNVLNREFPGITCAWDTSQILGLKEEPKDLADAAKTFYDMGYDPQQISVILNSPTLDPAINQGSGNNTLNSRPTNTPTPTTDENEDSEENSLIPGRASTFLKWAEEYADLEQLQFTKSENAVEESLSGFINQIHPFIKKGKLAKQARWISLWEDTVGKELERVGNQALSASIRVLHSVENQGKISSPSEVAYAVANIPAPASKKLKELIKSQVQESTEILLSVLKELDSGKSLLWDKLNLSFGALAKSLVAVIKEAVRFLTFQLLGVKSLIWISKGSCHQVLHGQRIELGKGCFPSIEAEHPHQKGLPLSEVIRCTCTTVPLEFLRI